MSMETRRLSPSQNATIYSLIDGEPYVGMPPLSLSQALPVHLYARDSAITGHQTGKMDGLLVSSKEREVQRQCIQCAGSHDAVVGESRD